MCAFDRSARESRRLIPLGALVWKRRLGWLEMKMNYEIGQIAANV